MRRFPSVSIFNVGDLLAQVRAVIDKAATAVQSVFAFTLLAGVTVLLAAVLERLRLPDVQRVETRLLVAIGIQARAEAGAELGVAAGVEHTARADQREIDVEQNELRPRAHRPGP